MKETEGSGRWDVSIVFIRPDGSYLIRRLDIVCGNALYHVPNEGKWKGMFDVLTDYVSEHPETLRDIPVHTPTLEEVKTAKLSEINAAAEQGHSHTHGDLSRPGDQHVRQAGIRGPRLCRRPYGFNAASFGTGRGTGHSAARPCGEGTRQGRRLCRGFRLHHRPASGTGRSA